MTPLAFLLALCLQDPTQTKSPTFPFEPVIMDSLSGSQVAIPDLVMQLKPMDVIVLGEEHDNHGAHALQASIVRELVQQGANLAISMEMFEKDVQGAVDDYLAGRIDEAAFLAASRPWKNYPEHYKPILEIARESKIPVLAANTPRDVAAKVAKGESVSLSLAPFQARATVAPEDRYWELFQGTMKGHGGVENSEASKKFYQAQCLKDDTMAESITDFLATHRHRRTTVVHLCGKFHSDYGQGTVARILTRQPLLHVAVLSTEKVDSLQNVDVAKHRDRAHYLMLVPPNSP